MFIRNDYLAAKFFVYCKKKTLSVIKKLAGQTAIYGLSTIVGRFINYLLVPIQTRVFNQAQFGIISGLFAYITFLNVLLTHGMETAFFRFAEKRNHENAVYSTSLKSVGILSILFASLVFLFSEQISDITEMGAKAIYIQLVAAIIALDAISSIPFALLRRQNKALRFAIIKNAGIAINILLNLYFLLLCPYWFENHGTLLPFYENPLDIGVIFFANLASSLLSFLLLIPQMREISLSSEKALYKEMLAYALPMMLVGFAGMINETIDRILIIYLIPDKELALRMNGIYSANYKLSIIITLFIQAFKYSAEPFFFSHSKNSNKRTVYADVMNIFILVCLGIFLMVTLNIHLFDSFIGKDFREGIHIVPILLWANIFLGMYYNISIWYKITDQTGKGANISVIGAIITIVMNFILIPILGYMGSAIATLICYLSMMIIGYKMGQKYYPIPYDISKFFKYSIISLVIYFAGIQLQSRVESEILYYTIGFSSLLLFGLIGYYNEKKTIQNLS
jgi:O-antigen/teichoic acid export membrane protein